MLLHLDYETKSAADLKAVGLYNYARDPSTDIWLARYAFDDGPVMAWCPSEPCPSEVYRHIEAGGRIGAHNAKFEVEICNNIAVPRYGWPEIRIAQCVDTMLVALTMAHPAALEKAVKAARLNIEKDMEGHRLMQRMARPRRLASDGCIVWWDDPERLERLSDYCEQDVRAERALHAYADELSASEQELAGIDYAINARGVYLDRDLAQAALALTAKAKERLNAELQAITGGWVKGVTDAAGLGNWLRQVGVPATSVAKDKVIALLKTVTDPTARRALELRQQGAKSSTAKLQKMLAHAGPDGRIRHTMQMNAAGTGRWGGRVIQPQNLPRPELLKSDDAVAEAILYVRTGDIDAIERVFGPPLVVIADLLRAMLAAPPGKDLIAGDWSAVEGRMLAWLAGEEGLVQAYRDFDRGLGEEIYRLTAGGILGKPADEVTGDERQAYGKVSTLACGYGGGVGAFLAMAATYGVRMAEHYRSVVDAADAEDVQLAHRRYKEQRERFAGVDPHTWVASEVVKIGWRRKHPAICAYWWALEDGALKAMREPGAIYGAGPRDHRRIYFRLDGHHLYCRLPSGRKLCYPWPELQPKKTPWGEEKEVLTYETMSPQGQWVRTHTYGGRWSENVTQAACADLLRHALRLLQSTPYEVVLHVHDEIVAEVPKGVGAISEFVSRLCTLPKWAAGLPIAAGAWRGPRFKKD